MSENATNPPPPPDPPMTRRIAAVAFGCVITIAIAGSALFLAYQRTRTRDQEQRIARLIDRLELISPAAVADGAAALRDHPEEARRVVTAALRRLRHDRSPRARLAVVRLVREFAGDDSRVAQRLFDLRGASDETIASEAVASLVRLKPPTLAADYLGRCLDDAVSPAVVDVVCDSLLMLGAAGRDALVNHYSSLSIDRRIWLVGLIQDRHPADMLEWLGLLAADASPAVRSRALAALRARPVAVSGSKELTHRE